MFYLSKIFEQHPLRVHLIDETLGQSYLHRSNIKIS